MEEFRKFFKGIQGSPNEQRDAPFLRCYDFAALEPVRRADLRRNGRFRRPQRGIPAPVPAFAPWASQPRRLLPADGSGSVRSLLTGEFYFSAFGDFYLSSNTRLHYRPQAGPRNPCSPEDPKALHGSRNRLSGDYRAQECPTLDQHDDGLWHRISGRRIGGDTTGLTQIASSATAPPADAVQPRYSWRWGQVCPT